MAEWVGTRRSGKIFGFPLQGFGLLTSLLLAFASAFLTFFASTTVAIFSLLAWNVFGHHAIDYADSYRYVGFPCGILVLPLFGALWLRAKMQR